MSGDQANKKDLSNINQLFSLFFGGVILFASSNGQAILFLQNQTKAKNKYYFNHVLNRHCA